MNNKMLTIFLMVIFFCCVYMPAKLMGETISPELNQALTKGNIASAMESCAETLYSTDDPTDFARINVIMSMLLFLNRNPDAVDRASTIRNFMVDPESPDENSAKAVLGYLGKQLSGKMLFEQMKQADPNWQATAFVARYIRILNELGLKPKILNQCIMQYMKIAETLQPDEWGNAWKERLILWHNSLQTKDGEIANFEPLICQVIEDELNGPIKEQLMTINTILNNMLQNRKHEVQRNIKKAFIDLGADKDKAENKPYITLLNYLSGKAINIKDVFQSTITQPDFFLMTTIAAFVKTLADTKPGDIYKSLLLSYLDNYETNMKNSTMESVLNWHPGLEKWKNWCSNDFPDSPSLKPLLRTHCKAFAIKNREELAKKATIKLYNKLKMVKSLSRVSMAEYKKVRAIFKDRPRPESMSFSSQSMQPYLRTLPSEVKQGEGRRLAYMNSFKKLMASNLSFSQYSGSIKMQKKTIKGKVTKADINFITIKSSHGTKKYKWGEIKPEQYIIFQESYINNNIGGKVRGKHNIFSSRSATDNVLTKEYRYLAIFCDWYGRYPEAIKFAKKADAFASSKGATRKLLLQ